jgi:phosphatidate cytidylyltransferase
VNWRSFLTRMLLVAVALPILGVFVFVVPQRTHLAFAILVAAVSVIGALEVRGLFEARGVPTSRWLAPALAGTLPILSWLEVSGLLPVPALELAGTAVAVGVILVRAIVFQRVATLPGILAFASSSLMTLLYPAFLLAWLPRLAALARPGMTIAWMLCVVFGDDMLAYFVGSLLGKSNRLGLVVSPQKSAVGFAGGLAGAVIAAVLFSWASGGFPAAGLGPALGVAVAVGAAAIIGDLAESGLKRSAGVKDSGVVIPGRGGVLDSVDSIALAAPVYYLLVRVLARWG